MLSFTVGNLRGASEIWVDGQKTGTTVSADGSYTLSKTLNEGKHTITLYDAAHDVNVTVAFTVGHITEVLPAVDATCTTAGKTQGEKCLVCGKVLTEQKVVPAKGHTEVTDEAVAATCTEAGKTEGKHCSVCNTVINAQQTIPATGHNEVPYEDVEMTCTRDGRTGGTYCTKCNATLVEPSITKAPGHTLTRWTPAGTNHHVKTCTTCEKQVESESCTSEDICVVCGRVKETETLANLFALGEDIDLTKLELETLKQVGGVTAGTLPGQILVRTQKVNNNIHLMTIAIVKRGVVVQPEEPVTITMPAEAVDGYTLILVKDALIDGEIVQIEEVISVTIQGTKATFTVDFTEKDAAYIRMEKIVE